MVGNGVWDSSETLPHVFREQQHGSHRVPRSFDLPSREDRKKKKTHHQSGSPGDVTGVLGEVGKCFLTSVQFALCNTLCIICPFLGHLDILENAKTQLLMRVSIFLFAVVVFVVAVPMKVPSSSRTAGDKKTKKKRKVPGQDFRLPPPPPPPPRSHGPGDVGGVLLGLHAQHSDAGRAALELRLALKGVVVAVGGRRQQGVGAEEVVEGDVAELALLVGEAHVAVVGAGAGGRAGRVGVGGDAGGRAPGQHAGGDHGGAGSRAGPQVVGELVAGRRQRVD